MSDETKITPGGTDQGLVARLGGKVRGLRDQVRALTNERDALKGKNATLETEAIDLRKRADESLVGAELAKLKQEVRTGKHRAKFDEIALKKGLKKEAL